MVYAILAVGLTLMALERLVPDQKLPVVHRWWFRVIIINCFQISIVWIGGLTWDRWFQSASIFTLRDKMGPITGAFVVYLVLTFVYYWWHRIRHDNQFLWLSCHQLHHSASRIETITSFYKHPFEIFLNGLIVGSVTYFVFGLDIEAGAYVTLFSALAEFFYHMNIKTPRWVGYFLQRPEMHRIHHQRGRHYNNFSDLPLWDMLFGTFSNPPTYDGACGFKPERELAFVKMLTFKDVNDPYVKKPRGMRKEAP